MISEGGISRERFLKLAGVAGAGTALGGAAWVAKARTVRAQAKTTGKLSDYCKGDGSDETAQIQMCFDEHRIVEVDAPPAGVGYGFAGAQGIMVRSGHEVRGIGEQAKLLRVPGTSGKDSETGSPLNRCFRNKNEVRGSQGLVFENLYIEGRGRTDLASMWDNNFSQARLWGAAFSLITERADRTSSNVTLTDVTILEWPGQSIRSRNIEGWFATRVYSRGPARGAHVLTTRLRNVRIHSCESTESGDDSFALNAGEGRARPEDKPYAYDFEIWDCKASTRQSKKDNGGGNHGIAVRGSQNGSILRCSVHNSAKDGYTIQEFNGHRPRRILVFGCETTDAGGDGIGVRASRTGAIRLRNNRIYRPQYYGTSWTTRTQGPARFKNCLDSANSVSEAGKGKRYIESNIEGVDVS